MVIISHCRTQELKAPLTYCCNFYVAWHLFDARPSVRNFFSVLNSTGQRIVTHVPVGFCTKFGDFHPELRIFLNLS